MTEISLPLALLAGLVSFASPCFLPVVPVFIGYLVGDGERDDRHQRLTNLAQALVFVSGFAIVFIGLWASLGVVGYALADHRAVLRIAGGALLVVLGLHVAGLVEIPLLSRQVRPTVDTHAAAPSYRRSALLGLAFGAGWTPCIGPILGGVLGLAASSGTVARGTVLLVAYIVGLAVPFVLIAAGAADLSRRLRWFTRHHTAVELASGAFIALTGFAMITNLFTTLAGRVPAVL